MKVREVSAGVFEISLAWSNVYVLKEGKRAALIDTGLMQDRPDLLAALSALGIGENGLEAIYLTHAHCDHAGSAAFFAERGAKLCVHHQEAVHIGLPRRTYLPTGLQFWTRWPTSLLFALGEWRYPVARCTPDIMLHDGQIIEAPGGALRVVETPGHTPGHSAFLRESDGVLFSGDAILNLIPIRRTNGLSLPPRVLNSDSAQARESARRLAELAPAVLLSGHGWPLREKAAERLRYWATTF